MGRRSVGCNRGVRRLRPRRSLRSTRGTKGTNKEGRDEAALTKFPTKDSDFSAYIMVDKSICRRFAKLKRTGGPLADRPDISALQGMR